MSADHDAEAWSVDVPSLGRQDAELIARSITEGAIVPAKFAYPVSLVFPSLPQRAGKAIAGLAFFTTRLQWYVVVRVQAPVRKKGSPTELQVLGQVNPHLDPARIAKILFDAAMEQREQDRKDQNKAA
jgi:hypothetical protein